MTDVFTHAGQRPRVLLEDPEASHQIKLIIGPPGNSQYVSCTCRARRGHPPMACTEGLTPAAARGIWRQHLGILASGA